LRSFDAILLTGFGASQCLNTFAATWQHERAANLVDLISTFQILFPGARAEASAPSTSFSGQTFLILFDPL